MDTGQESAGSPDAVEDEAGPATRRWRVEALVFAPAATKLAPDGGFPETLEFESRLSPQARIYGGTPVAIRELPKDDPRREGLPPDVEPVALFAEVDAPDPPEAVATAGRTFEPLIDLMSFDMGCPLALGQVMAIDVSPPLSSGEQRDMAIFASSPFDVNARSVEMSAIQGRLSGELPGSIDLSDSKDAAALRWFVKALGTQVLHDQFIFLWIALEILTDASGTKVEAPYVGPCHHEIPECPECGRATTRMVRGQTMKAFLQRHGVSEQSATVLWQIRQLMHGAIPFDSKKLEELGAQVQVLRAAVAKALKEQLGIPPTEPPIIASSGFSIHPAMAAMGSTKIDQDSLEPLIPN